MRVPFVDLKGQYALLQPELEEAFKNIFLQGQFVGGGEVHSFEEKFATKLGVRHCVGVGNGTDALFLSLKALGIGPGDEVITPAWSWISSAETISQTGATPIFTDVDEFYTISVDDVEKKLTNKTRAVIAVHLYGQPADVTRLTQLCKLNQLFLIEDCAQAHFSKMGSVCAGTFGDVAAFSFYPTKNLGAYGDAGAVVTHHAHLAEKVRRLANHGGLSKDEHLMEGFNSRLDPLQAAALSVKLNYVMTWNDRRNEHASFYHDHLSGIGDLIVPQVRPQTTHSFHLYVVRTSRRDLLKQFLSEQGIETQVHYPRALPFEPAYQGLTLRSEHFPNASKFQQEVLSLPVYPELTEAQLGYVCDQIKKFFQHGD